MTAKMITAEQVALLDPLAKAEGDRIAPLSIGYMHVPESFSEFLYSVNRQPDQSSDNPVLRDRTARANFMIHERQIDDRIAETFRRCVDEAVEKIHRLDQSV